MLPPAPKEHNVEGEKTLEAHFWFVMYPLWVRDTMSGFAKTPVVSEEWPTQTGCYCVRQVRVISLISHLRFYFSLASSGYLICLWYEIGKLTIATTAVPLPCCPDTPWRALGGPHSPCRCSASSINSELTKVPSYWQMCLIIHSSLVMLQ